MGEGGGKPYLARGLLVSSHVTDFNARNKMLTAKLLQQAIGMTDVEKPVFFFFFIFIRKCCFSKFYCRHSKLVSKFKVGLKSLLQRSLSEAEFYDDLVYKFQ